MKIEEEQKAEVNLSWTEERPTRLRVWVVDRSVAEISDTRLDYRRCVGELRIRGVFLGRTAVRVCHRDQCGQLPVTVLKRERTVTRAFIISVAVLVTLSYVNMGCALDLAVVKTVLLKPVGPLVGFLCQYLIMPLVAYGVGLLIFTDPALQLGQFIFGCSPSGGASNMWTVLLNGNLNLSLTVTFVNNVMALGMMPLWLFTLGKSLFITTTTSIPFRNIFTTLISMIVPLGIGILMQKYFPRTAKFLKKTLATVSVIIILFIIIFGIYANLYMFKLFDWKIILAAMINVWFGFALSALATYIIGFSIADRVALMVETGIQNTGIAYVLLNSSLSQPDSDIASVVPIAGSIVTPIPLFFIYIYQKLRNNHFLCSFKNVSDEEKKQIIQVD